MTRALPFRFVCVLMTCASVVSGCSSPPVGHDSLAEGRTAVVRLLNDSGSVLPSHATLGSTTRSQRTVKLGFSPSTADDLDREICHKTFAGYAFGTTGAEQPEVRTIIEFPDGVRPDAYLDAIVAHWKRRGYTVDLSRRHESRYPQVRATTGDYTIYTTSLAEAAGFAGSPKLTMYAVSACLEPGSGR